MRDDSNTVADHKPFHLMTPAERTALRIAQNRAIDEKVASTKAPEKNKKPPATSTNDFTRVTPEERARLVSGVIRKVK